MNDQSDDRRLDSVGIGLPGSVRAGGRENGEHAAHSNAVACAENEHSERLSEADGWSDEYIMQIWRHIRDGRGRRRAALPRPDSLPAPCHIADLQHRLAQYVITADREWLVDIGFIAMAEWIKTDVEPCAPHVRGERCK